METVTVPGGARQERVSIEVLEEFLDSPPVQIVARRLALPRSTIYRWRREGGIPYYTADRIALRLGTHPVLIWPDYHQETPCPT